MRILPVLFALLITASFCYGDQKTTVQVIGISECADCQKNNIKHSHAFKGLKVTIDCKLANGDVKRRGEGKLDEEGKFSLDIPHELVEKEKLKEECYAQLHSASDIPCPAHDGIESSKLAFVSESDGKHTFSPVGKLKFSPVTCTSAFLWPHFKYPPYHKSFPKLPFPKIPCPPIFKKPFFKHPFPHFPKYKEPLPPIYEKPIPPPTPVYEKPIPPPTPVSEKPIPPPTPVYEKPPIPVYKPKPLPLLPKFPPIYKKPCPPIPKLPPFKFPPFHKFPPKIYEHPKFKKWHDLPPFPSHP